MEYEASFGQWLTLRRQALHLPRGELAGRALTPEQAVVEALEDVVPMSSSMDGWN